MFDYFSNEHGMMCMVTGIVFGLFFGLTYQFVDAVFFLIKRWLRKRNREEVAD